MVSLIFRNAGAWGPGKGSRLTSLEVDDNFFSLKQAVEDLQLNPTLPLEITDVTISGRTVTFHLSDLTTTFSVDMPLAQFRFRGDWLPATDYLSSDFFSHSDGLYIVLQDHTSNPTFSSTDGNVNGPYYRLVIKAPSEVFEIPVYVRDLALQGSPLFERVIVQPVVLPANLPGSFAILRNAPTNDLTLDICLNDVACASISFAAGDVNGVLVNDVDVGFVPGDLFQVFLQGDVDPTAEFFVATLVLQLGELS